LGITLLTPPLFANERQALENLGLHSFGQLAIDDRSSNSAVFVGNEAALVVDPGLTPGIAQDFLNRVGKEIGEIPIRYVVLSHWHPDHALGALCIENPGMQIIAHPFTAKMLQQQAADIIAELAEQATLAEEQQAFLSCTLRFPDHFIEDTETIDLGGISVRVFHPGHGHTAGDLVAWAETDRVLVAGDIFMHAASPYMGEADPRGLVKILDELVALNPERVVAGHFGLSSGTDLEHFRDYMSSLVSQVEQGLGRGLTAEDLVESIDMSAFTDFVQYPQYNATFAGNAGDVAAALMQAPDYGVLARLDVGQAPHQISFSADGSTAYIAAAGSDQITMVDTRKLEISGHMAAPGVPLGVIPLTDGKSLAITRFHGEEVLRYDLTDGTVSGHLTTGGAPSLIQGPLPGNRYLVSVEKANSVWLLNADTFQMDAHYPTGSRPFPAAATSDGKYAFVPNYDDDTVTVIDLVGQQVTATIPIGKNPSGGAVLPGDEFYAIAVRGENRIALMDTRSYEVTGYISEGIGESPFSVVISVDGKKAFVNNTASHDVSVIDLAKKQVVTRIKTGEIPIVMAVHPDGNTLWVSCEGSHDVYVIRIPE